MNAVTPLKTDEGGPLVALDLEQQVLGGLLANNKVFDRVAGFLMPEHFGDARHAEIYACIKAMIEAGKPATPPMLAGYLDATGTLSKVGGNAYIAKIVTGIASPQFTEDYSRALLDLWSRRQAVAVIEDAALRLRRADLTDPAADQLAQAATQLDELATLGTAPSVVPVGDAGDRVVESVTDIVDHGVVPQLIPTGFHDLDRVIGGLEAGEMIVLAARPSMGKTALAQWMAYNAGKAGHGVAFFSIEMMEEPLTRRWISGLANVPAIALKTGKVFEKRYGQNTARPLDRDEMARIRAAAAEMHTVPIYVDARSAPTAAEIVASVRKMEREKKAIDLVVVDYLGLMRSQDKWGKRYDTVTAISNELKAAAKKLRKPLLVLCQLSRANESRDDKRPGLSDLRDSGAIEQDADSVWMLHREHYYLARAVPQQRAEEMDSDFNTRRDSWSLNCQRHEGKAELAILKSRGGAVETINLAFRDAAMRFDNLEDDRDGGEG